MGGTGRVGEGEGRTISASGGTQGTTQRHSCSTQRQSIIGRHS